MAEQLWLDVVLEHGQSFTVERPPRTYRREVTEVDDGHYRLRIWAIEEGE